MPSLSTKVWRRWPLNIGDNLQRPEAEQAFIEVRSGLTSVELDAVDEAVTAIDGSKPEAPAAFAAALGPWMRLGGHFELDGAEVKTLEDLARAGLASASQALLIDVVGSLRYWNSLKSGRELFTERLSGGASGTASSRG